MAGWKKSKTTRDLKKRQEGKRKSVLKLVDNARKGSSSPNPYSNTETSTKLPSSASSLTSIETSMNYPLTTNTVTFSQTVKSMGPSPQKSKPVINLTQSNTLQMMACKARETKRSDTLKQLVRRTKPPKAVIPGPLQDSRCWDPDFLIRDKRHENGSLVYLPKEPDIKRTPNFVRTGHFRFLDLPAEIRNQIYEYLIELECYAIKWDSEGCRGKQLTHRLPKRSNAWQPRLSQSTRQRRLDLKKHPRCAEREKLMSDLYCNCSPVALSWVCRKMYVEASSMFYSRSTFIFEGVRPLRHFMNNVTLQNKASITKLKLIYKAYGHPAKTENQIWKVKAERKWEDLCWRVTDEFTSLTHLTLDLDYGYSKLQFIPFFDLDCRTFGTDWRIPLWAFDDLDLQSCACRIRSATTSEAVLEVESYKIRQALLGDAWNDEAERERDAFGGSRKWHYNDGKQRKAVSTLQINYAGEVFGHA